MHTLLRPWLGVTIILCNFSAISWLSDLLGESLDKYDKRLQVWLYQLQEDIDRARYWSQNTVFIPTKSIQNNRCTRSITWQFQYMALIPFSAFFVLFLSLFFVLARLKLPVFDKVIPLYVKLSFTFSSNPCNENFQFSGKNKILSFFSLFTWSHKCINHTK